MNIGFNDAWVKLLKSVKTSKDKGKKNMMQLWRDTGLSYSHIEDLVKALQNIGLIYCEPNGREIQITLTKKGKQLKKDIMNIEASGYFSTPMLISQ